VALIQKIVLEGKLKFVFKIQGGDPLLLLLLLFDFIIVYYYYHNYYFITIMTVLSNYYFLIALQKPNRLLALYHGMLKISFVGFRR